MLKAVIFDLDGLLADTEPLSFRIYQELLAPYGLGFPLSHYAAHYSGRTAIANLQQCRQEFGLDTSVDELLCQTEEIERQLLAEGVDLKKGAYTLLHYLRSRGLSIALATSSVKDRAEGILNKAGIAGYFDVFVCAADIQHSKPHPEIFLRAAQKLGLSPVECLVLEDSEAGVEAAFRAGIPVIHIPDMKDISPAHRAMTAGQYASLDEVIPYIQENCHD